MKKNYIIILVTFISLGIQHAMAQYTSLYDFQNAPDGNRPTSDLYYDGTFLYGMTERGGINDSGTIFKVMPNGSGYLKLFDFAGTANGRYPNGSLISDGTFLYGMTNQGGTYNLGVIFKIKPDGSGYVNLLDFAGTSNGKQPLGDLVYDGTFLYGMASSGGANNYGTIFKIMSNGTGYVKLLDFAGTTNGSYPCRNLYSDGTFLYGMTQNGGANNKGTTFKILPDGTGYVNLLDFAGTTNGSNPCYGSLISDGTFLYGITRTGGTNNLGTIFKIMPDGSGYLKLLDFTGAASGISPYGSLFYDGTFLYGMTKFGGTNNDGCIFKIKTDGTNYLKLLDFSGTDGKWPYGNLISDGICLYGMTYIGGANSAGKLFKLCGVMQIEEAIDSNQQLTVYPNPTNSTFTIKTNTTDKQTVDLYDVNGRHVFTKSVAGTEEIDATILQNGVYTLTIKSLIGITNKKLVIVR